MACERENVSLFLLAGQVGTTDKAIAKLKAIAPNLKITGHHGYFDKFGSENQSVIAKINQFKPIPLPKEEDEKRGRSVVELLSSQTTTQQQFQIQKFRMSQW